MGSSSGTGTITAATASVGANEAITSGTTVDDYYSHNLYVDWSGPWETQLAVSIVNLLDEDPPEARHQLGYNPYRAALLPPNGSNSVSHVPPDWPSVVPRLVVADPQKAVEFLRVVFGATGEFNEARPSEMRIGDGMIMVGGSLERAATSAFIYVYVPDVDASYDRALRAGSTSIEPPEEMPYGDRRAMIRDPWGNYWQIATHRTFDC